jgi:hypothetical protein
MQWTFSVDAGDLDYDMMGKRGAAIALLTTSLLAGFARSAFADPKDPTAAEALFLAGRDAMQRGDIATACAKFGESDRLDPAAGTAANLADCEEKLGKVSAAWAHWKEAVELLPAGDTRMGPMSARAAALEKRVPRLTVRAAPTLPPDATLVRDGFEMTRASFDTAIPDDPGDHEIVVTAPKHAARSYKINLKEAESKEIVIDAGELLPDAPPPVMATPLITPLAPTPPDQVDAHPGRTSRVIGYSLLGVGVIGAGIGTVTGLVAIGKKNDLSGNCFPANVCNAQGASDASSGQTMATVSTISFIVAGAALAGGALLILTAPHPKAKKITGSLPNVAPWIGPGLIGIFAEQSF